MARLPRKWCALTVAGSDSGGGAGIQADLATFAALGVHGATVITCITAQNPTAVTAVQPVRPDVVRSQLEAVAGELEPAAIKTGMLYSAAIIRVVADFLGAWGKDRPAVVVDPVMVATSGARLLRDSAVRILEERLLPLARLVTPNLDEARILAGFEVRDLDGLRRASRVIRDRYGCAALVKGGHLAGPTAVDVFWDGSREWVLEAPRVLGVSSHGTGCTYSAAIAAHLACGSSTAAAVRRAKSYIGGAIAGSRRVGRHPVLGHGSSSAS